MTEPAAAERPLRRDAQRTRQLVLDAARRLFSERGVEVGFDEIARVAGVGTGTVYRRFPDRESLVAALFEEKGRDIVAVADAALALEDPWAGIVWFCQQTVQEMQGDRGLAQVLTGSAVAHQHFDQLRATVAGKVEHLVRRAQDAGVLRADVRAPDLALLAHLLGRVVVDDGTELWRRYLALFLDGFRARADLTPLPGPEPTIEVFERMAQRR